MVTDGIRKEAERGARLTEGLHLYAQVTIGLCLFLTEWAGTPGWISILLTLPWLLLCLVLRKRVKARPGKTAWLIAAVAAWLDGALAYYALCVLCRGLLPDRNPWLVAGMLAAFAIAAGGRCGVFPILARPVAPLIIVPLLYCAGAALPHARVGHLFPLLGRGGASIGWAAVWMCGCVSTAALPASPWKTGDGHSSPGTIVAFLIAGAATALLYALLLPYLALTRADGLAEKWMLPTHLSGPIAIWPLLIMALLLLLFFSLSFSLARTADALARAQGRFSPSRLTVCVPALLMLPLGAVMTAGVRQALIVSSPIRAMLTLALLMGLNLKKSPVKGAEHHA
ncbi:MAG: hypothetical protein IJ662_12930 [Clostridia bacterium]|nr:hypothetical protein [Clostridia bacterium]